MIDAYGTGSKGEWDERAKTDSTQKQKDLIKS